MQKLGFQNKFTKSVKSYELSSSTGFVSKNLVRHLFYSSCSTWFHIFSGIYFNG